jgi:hypothetical protein
MWCFVLASGRGVRGTQVECWNFPRAAVKARIRAFLEHAVCNFTLYFQAVRERACDNERDFWNMESSCASVFQNSKKHKITDPIPQPIFATLPPGATTWRLRPKPGAFAKTPEICEDDNQRRGAFLLDQQSTIIIHRFLRALRDLLFQSFLEQEGAEDAERKTCRLRTFA